MLTCFGARMNRANLTQHNAPSIGVDFPGLGFLEWGALKLRGSTSRKVTHSSSLTVSAYVSSGQDGLAIFVLRNYRVTGAEALFFAYGCIARLSHFRSGKVSG